jgi:hypothetical protein
MFGKSNKSTTIKSGRPAALQTTRNATAGRGLQASRGVPVGMQVSSPAAERSLPTDRLGVAVTLLLSLALTAGGALMVSQIWANLAMIR